MRERPSSTPLKNVALAATSTLLFAALLEGGARLLEPPPVQREEYLWDWSERFKDGEFYTLEKGEGYPPSEENNVDGLRDRTRPIETREGLHRIAILGDSVTFGHGLESAQAFPALLERRLRGRGHDVEVFNVALPGWSTRQERIAYARLVRKYRPDAVILAVCLNDIAELQINLAKPPDPTLLSLYKRSAAVRLAMGASRREIGAVEDLFRDADSARVQRALLLFQDEVRALRNEVTQGGARFQVLVFPFRFQTEPGSPPPVVQQKIAEFAKTEEIPLLDVLPDMLKVPDPQSLFLDYDHLSVLGHDRVGLWLADHLEFGRGLPPLPSGLLPWNSPGAEGGHIAGTEQQLRTLEENPALISDARLRALALRFILAQAVDDPAARVRFQAARTVFALGLPDVSSVPALIRGVQHDDPRVRAFATWTLGEMGPIAKDAVPALVALARKDGGAGKTGALTAIGKIGGDSKETIPLLLQELQHPKENRRYRAARTIGRMGVHGAPAIDGLIAALRDESPLVRRTAVEAIAELGEAGRKAVPALTSVMNGDVDPEVREAVSRTLSKLPGR